MASVSLSVPRTRVVRGSARFKEMATGGVEVNINGTVLGCTLAKFGARTLLSMVWKMDIALRGLTINIGVLPCVA